MSEFYKIPNRELTDSHDSDFWTTEREWYEVYQREQEEYEFNKLTDENEIIKYIEEDPYRMMYIPYTELRGLTAIKSEPSLLEYINNQTVEMCIEALKASPELYKFVKPININKIVCNTLINISVGIKSLHLPSYIVSDIVDGTLMMHQITHFIKINKVIHINEFTVKEPCKPL